VCYLKNFSLIITNVFGLKIGILKNNQSIFEVYCRRLFKYLAAIKRLKEHYRNSLLLSSRPTRHLVKGGKLDEKKRLWKGCVAGKTSVNAQTKQGKHSERKTPLDAFAHFLFLNPHTIVYLQLPFCLCVPQKQTE